MENNLDISYSKQPNGNFLLMVNGTPNVVSVDHPMYKQIDLSLAHNDAERAVGYLNVPVMIRQLSGDFLSINEDGSALSYQGHEISTEAASTVLRMIHEDMPFLPLLNWLGKVVKNPSYRAQCELYPFMHRKVHRLNGEFVPLPITADGDFLAYKAVRDDWMDWHSNSYCNKPGETLRMPRSRVDDDCRNTCSNGFHVGSLAYVKDFHPGQSRIVVTAQSPEHVVSIPADADGTKCRVCEYTVLREFEKELVSPVYILKQEPQYELPSLTPVQPTSPVLTEWVW